MSPGLRGDFILVKWPRGYVGGLDVNFLMRMWILVCFSSLLDVYFGFVVYIIVKMIKLFWVIPAILVSFATAHGGTSNYTVNGVWYRGYMSHPTNLRIQPN